MKKGMPKNKQDGKQKKRAKWINIRARPRRARSNVERVFLREPTEAKNTMPPHTKCGGRAPCRQSGN